MVYRLIVLLLCAACPVGAVCHVVTPSGSGAANGNDWNNAFAGIPGTLVRGDVYYLGTGTYLLSSSGITFNTAVSGATLITVKGAKAGDSCTATGFSSALNTSISPARFQPNLTWSSNTSGQSGHIWMINSDHWLFDGNNCTANQIRKSGQGILLDNSASTTTDSTLGNILGIGAGVSVSDVTVQCVELKSSGMGSALGDPFSITSITCNGAGTSATATINGNVKHFGPSAVMPATQIAVTGVPSGNFNSSHTLVKSNPSATQITYTVSCTPNATASSGTVDGAYNYGEFSLTVSNAGGPGVGTGNIVRYVSIHDCANTPIQVFGGSTGLLFDYIDIERYSDNHTFHSEAFTLEGGAGAQTATDMVIRYSVILDGEGTGQVVALFNSAFNRFHIYGNVFGQTVNNPWHRRGFGNGVFSCINSSVVCNNLFFYNNTISDQLTTSAGRSSIVIGDSATGSNWNVKNNLWWNSDICNSNFLSATTGSTSDYNTFLNTSSAQANCADSGGHSFSNSSAVNPFVNNTNFDYHLSSETIDPNLNDGLTIANANGQSYNIDPDNKTRGSDGTWDRGAFEFGGSSCSNPTVSSVTLNPTSVVGGNTSTGTVTLSCAPTSNTVVSLSSSNVAVATVPTVTVLANQTTANFTVSTNAVCVSTNVTITATFGGSTTAALTVMAGGGQCRGANVIGTAKVSGTAVVQ